MRIGVCDDQREVRKLIAQKIKDLYPKETVIAYESGAALLAEQTPPDILFLDIQMPPPDGMQTAKRLRRRNRQMILIFVTALSDYVFDAFDVGAFHYLVKPFSDAKFAEVLRNAVEQCVQQPGERTSESRQPHLVVTRGGEHVIVNPADIVYAEVYDRKIMLHTMEGDIEYYGRMKELAKCVGEDFYRPHRGYLVNLAYVRKYDAGTIYLEKGQALLSKQNYPAFVREYLKYNKRKGSL